MYKYIHRMLINTYKYFQGSIFSPVHLQKVCDLAIDK